MITVSELIVKLSQYAAQSPENGSAEVMLGSFGEVCYQFAGANDAREYSENKHLLIFIPDPNGKHIGIRQLRTS